METRQCMSGSDYPSRGWLNVNYQVRGSITDIIMGLLYSLLNAGVSTDALEFCWSGERRELVEVTGAPTSHMWVCVMQIDDTIIKGVLREIGKTLNMKLTCHSFTLKPIWKQTECFTFSVKNSPVLSKVASFSQTILVHTCLDLLYWVTKY